MSKDQELATFLSRVVPESGLSFVYPVHPITLLFPLDPDQRDVRYKDVVRFSSSFETRQSGSVRQKGPVIIVLGSDLAAVCALSLLLGGTPRATRFQGI